MKKIIKTACVVASITALSACSSLQSTGPGHAGGRTAGNDTGVKVAAAPKAQAAPVQAKAEKVFKASQSK